MAESYNEDQLRKLPAKAYTFSAETDGNFPEYNYPTDFNLTLKTGAQVMFIRNDNNGRYYNGRIGHITHVFFALERMRNLRLKLRHGRTLNTP